MSDHVGLGTPDAVPKRTGEGSLPSSEPDGGQSSGWRVRGVGVGPIAAWTLFAVVFTRTLYLSLTQDFRRQILVADQSSFLYMASSIANDHDLWIRQVDVTRWPTLGWTGAPLGLFFQVTDHGAAFAKPYGYPLLLAVVTKVVGAGVAVAVTNTLLFSLTTLAVLLLVHTRTSWPVAAVVTTALLGVSNVFFYVFPVGVELFMACLVAWFFLAAWHAVDGRLGWGAFAAVLAAVLLAEKQPMLPAIAPMVVLVIARQRGWLRRVGVAVVGVGTFALAVLPYLYYSGWKTITPYGGVRYFSYGGEANAAISKRSISDSVTGWSYIRDHAFSNPGEKWTATTYTLFGQHVGLLVWLPLAVFVVVLAFVRPRQMRPYGVAALAGLLGYLLFYIVLFPHNTYGASQSVGNRYFVQVSPIVAAVVAGTAIRARELVWASVLSILLVLVLVWPQYVVSPRDSLVHMERRSTPQKWFMWESDVDGVGAFTLTKIPDAQVPLAELRRRAATSATSATTTTTTTVVTAPP
jgi:hypothetical protein